MYGGGKKLWMFFNHENEFKNVSGENTWNGGKDNQCLIFIYEYNTNLQRYY